YIKTKNFEYFSPPSSDSFLLEISAGCGGKSSAIQPMQDRFTLTSQHVVYQPNGCTHFIKLTWRF
ncbi:MAG: hypothetical protein P8017_05475, partial [Deltaproteobacteria bacterium]